MNRWIMAVIAALTMSRPADAVEYTWTGAGGDGRWGTKANWSPYTGIPKSGDDVVLPEASANVVITLEADQAARSITFNPVNLFAYTLEGKSITLDDGGRIQFLKLAKGPPLGTKACQRVNSNIKLAGHASFGNS